MNTEQISRDYDAQWFKHFDGLKDEFLLVSDAIYRQFDLKRGWGQKFVVDVGCGPGLILSRLSEYSVKIWGMEGSVHGIEAAPEGVRERIAHIDITSTEANTLLSRPDVDLVICTEVAEHVPAAEAAALVKNICAPMCPIVFTAAPPGQGGHHHINEQPMEYWLSLFRTCGVIPDWVATEQLKKRWADLIKLGHMWRNVVVLR